MKLLNVNPQIEVVGKGRGETVWKLSESYYYYWEHGGVSYCFPIPAGFEFDGASVPWFLRWIAGRGRFGLLAPLVHDFLHHWSGHTRTEKYYPGVRRWRDYPGRKGFTREQADKLFFRILREKGVEPRWLRRGAYKAVRAWSKLNGDNWK